MSAFYTIAWLPSSVWLATKRYKNMVTNNKYELT